MKAPVRIIKRFKIKQVDQDEQLETGGNLVDIVVARLITNAKFNRKNYDVISVLVRGEYVVICFEDNNG